MRLAWDSGQSKDIWIENIEPQCLLQKRRDDAYVERDAEAQRCAYCSSETTDDYPVHHEYPEHASRTQAQCAQDCDIGALIVNNHDKGCGNIEHRNRNDQHEQQPHHRLLGANCMKIHFVVLGPVAKLKALWQSFYGAACQFWRFQDVSEFELFSGGSREPLKSLPVL